MRIIVGDVHGCRDEFAELLKKVDYRPGHDDLVVLGDLIDRGPDPVGTVALAMEMKARRVLGNHEEKALRWLAYEDRVAAEPGFRNPMEPLPDRPGPAKAHGSGSRPLSPEAEAVRQKRLEARLARGGGPVAVQQKRKSQAPKRPIPEERKAEWRALSRAQRAWLKASPLWLDLPGSIGSWLAVHAGFEPKPLKEQRADRVIRVRYVDPKTGDIAPYVDGTLNQPSGSILWQAAWKGPQNIVYGHAVHSREEPRVDHIDVTDRGRFESIVCVGIDTGCCFGGRLTAMILDAFGRYRFEQVQAKRIYCPWPGGDGTTSGDS